MLSTSFSFQRATAHRDLPSFPTRRSSDLAGIRDAPAAPGRIGRGGDPRRAAEARDDEGEQRPEGKAADIDRKSTRLNSSHVSISYAVFCLKKKKQTKS